jgi:hypothetical protein
LAVDSNASLSACLEFEVVVDASEYAVQGLTDLFPPCEILPIWQKFADGKILTTNHST